MDVITGKTLVRKDMTEVLADDALKDKEIIALYFSAHWCPPCRMFTPVLADFYEEVQQSDLPLEVIFISSDRSADALFDYMKEAHGDWLAIPFGSPVIEEIHAKFSIKGIPTLLVIKKDGTLITENGRRDVETKGAQAVKDWLK